MEISTSFLFLQTATFASLILLIVSVIKFNVIRRGYYYFFGFIFLLFMATIGDYVLRPKFIPQNNNILYNIYTMLELPFCVYILNELHYKKLQKKVLIVLGIFFYSIVLFEVFKTGIVVSFYFTNYIASFFEILICMYTLYDLLETPSESLIYMSVSFWFSLGFLLYNAGTTFLFLLLDKLYILDQTLASLAFNLLNSIFSILFYIFLAISILCLKPKTLSS